MKKNIIQGFMEKYPDLVFIVLMIIGMMIDLAVAVNYAPVFEPLILYLLGVLLLIPVIAIIIYAFWSKLKTMSNENEDALKDKDRIISKQARKIEDDKDAVTCGEEASRLYDELKSRMAEQTATFEEYLKHFKNKEAIFEKVYVRDDFSQKLYRYVAFLWANDEMLDLFDPVMYLSDRYYNSWVNSNVAKWNKIIEENSNSAKMCQIRLRTEIENTKPKKVATDGTVPELERSSKKMAHITSDREDR